MNVKSLRYLPFIHIKYFPFYHVTRVHQQMVTYFRHFLSRAMFSPSYFSVWFRFSCIKLTTWASTLINNVCFVGNGVFQHKDRSNFSCFPKIPKFYFIVGKRFLFVNNTKYFIFISLQKEIWKPTSLLSWNRFVGIIGSSFSWINWKRLAAIK